MVPEPLSAGSRRIWATRPQEQNRAWTRLLKKAGYAVVDVPLMAIEPVTEPAAVQAVRDLILNFDQFQKVIFVSQNAVQTAFGWLADYWPQLPVGVQYLAVGKKTAEAIEANGVQVTAPEQSMDSDALLAMPALQSVWGEKILICRGRGGLPRLGEVLHQRGAIVRYCELYERRLPQTALDDVMKAWRGKCAEEEDIVPVFSGETLQHLVTVLDRLAIGGRALGLVVPGKRVAELAESMGFVNVVCAANASEPAMLEALASLTQQV